MTTVFRLPNGITGVCEERPRSGKVSMQIHVKLGSGTEAADENGLTNLMQESCLAGTAARSRAEIAEAIEAKGGSLGSMTGRNTTVFRAQALARHAKETFETLADVVRNPVFDGAEVEKTKEQIIQIILQEDQDARKQAVDKLFSATFTGQAYGASPEGTPESVADFTVAQLREKHAQLLAHPENIVVSFSGDIDAKTAQDLVEKAFGDLSAAPAPAKASVAFTGGDIREPRNNEQLNLYFGFPAPARSDADKYAAMLFEELLSGGMSSPLFQEIREKRGLVYSVGAEYADMETTGLFLIGAGTGKGNAGELMKVTFALLGEIARDGFSDEELARAADRIIRQMKDAGEKASGTAADNAGELLTEGRLISLDEHETALRNVTSDDVRRVCINMLKDGVYGLGAVGPQDTLPAQAEIKKMMQDSVKGIAIPQQIAPSTQAAFKGVSAAPVAPAAAEPQMTVLKNGMVVVTLERPGNLSCGAWVGAGSDHETEPLNGATHMNEHMMFKGTPSYGPGEIDHIVENELGGNLNAYTTRDKTCYYFYSLKPEALEKVVDICGEMVFKANLDHEEFDGKTVTAPDGSTVKNKGERDVVLEELRRSNDNVEDRAVDLLMAAAYPGQPHGWTILGPEKTLKALTVEQLAAYRDEFYVPNNVIFSAVGPVKHEDFVAIVEKKYGQMPSSPFPPLPAVSYQGGTVNAEADSARICTVLLAAPGVEKTSPDTYAYAALAAILGSGMSSLLYKKIVDEDRLSADIGVYNMDYRNAGTFMVMATAEAKNVKPMIAAVYEVIRGVAAGLTQEDLDKAKAKMEMGLLANMETNSNACDEIAVDVQDHGKVLTAADISAAINKLTLEDVKRVAQQVIAHNPAAAMVVPPGTDQSLLPGHAEVVAMRDGKKPPANAPAPKPRKAG
jgi:predicted Zn-dependent peptidase